MQKYKKILNNFLSKNKGFLPPEVQKNTALSTVAIKHIFRIFSLFTKKTQI